MYICIVKNLLMKLKGILYLFSLFVLIVSCKPKENLNYLQDIDAISTAEASRISQTLLQPGDQLVINVMAKDLDVVKPFNQNYSSGQNLQNNQISGNATTTMPLDSGPTYVVSNDSTIELPILGKIDVKNQSIDSLKDNLVLKLKKYIKEPTVSVKLNNFRISVMGEVNRPGEYLLPDGKGTLLSALSMAGDLTIYGVRDNVLIVRNVDGVMEKSRVNLTNSNFINSPYYNLKQGDVIYISSNETKQKSSRLDPNAGIYISVASIVVTILALVFKK